MKKFIYLLLVLPIAFTSCEMEKLDNSEELTATTAKAKNNKAKAASTLDWVDSDCTFSETDLIAGQNMVVGTVNVSIVGDNYIITYDVDAGYCLSETHLSVVTDREDFPMTSSGNPKNGNFEYSDSHGCVSSVSYEVPISKGPYIAAHAVVNCESQSLEEIVANLPETVEFCTGTQGPEAYLNITVTDNLISGNYGAWCIDDDLGIALNTCYEDVEVYSSTETLPADTFEYPENFDKVNWLLNQDIVGAEYTYGDLQFAIWRLLDDVRDDACNDCGFGDWSIERAEELVQLAMDNGDGFIPDCGDFMGIILLPDGVQPLIIPFPIECNDCEETAWAKGCDFPGNNWAMYFEYFD